MKFDCPTFNARVRAPGYNIGNVNNVVTEAHIPSTTYPNVCGGMGDSHPPDLKIPQTAAVSITRTSDTRVTAASGTPWVASSLIGQWACTFNSGTKLGNYVRITANTTTTIDTSGVFFIGCDRVKTSVWLPKIVVGAHGQGTTAFAGCCFDGESVWQSPYNSANFMKVNVATGQIISLGAHGEGASAFYGCCFDGESVWFSPYSGANFIKVNATTGVKTSLGAHGEAAGAFTGCCFDGESVWFAPFNATNFTKINVATGVKTVVAAHGEGSNPFIGCCFDGENVWFAPYASSNFVKINVSTNVITKIPHGEGASAFRKCCFDGENVWFAPSGASNFVKINAMTGLKTVVLAHGDVSGPFHDCCFDGENVWFAPLNSDNIVKVNVATGVKTVVGQHVEAASPFHGCCFDGENVWYSPLNATNFVKTPVPRSGRASSCKPIVAGTGVFNSKLAIATSTIAPSAKLHLGPGTTTVPPMKLVSGSLVTTPESGSIEYSGNYYYTGYDNVRYLLNTFTGSVPATSASMGVVGQYALDTNYLYVCYAASSWNRFSIT
jgi:hypothetical protein